MFHPERAHLKKLKISLFFEDKKTQLFESLWQWTKTTTEKTTQWTVSMKVCFLTANHFLEHNYNFLELFYIFVTFLWQRRQITTEKTAWRKLFTFSKRFAKQFTSSTTFLFRDFDHFFLGQFTTRTNFQQCTFYWNPGVEAPQNHDRKDVLFRKPRGKKSQKTVKNKKNSEICNSDKFGHLVPGLKIPSVRALSQVFSKNRKSVFCVLHLGNARNTPKYWKKHWKNSK